MEKVNNFLKGNKAIYILLGAVVLMFFFVISKQNKTNRQIDVLVKQNKKKREKPRKIYITETNKPVKAVIKTEPEHNAPENKNTDTKQEN